MAYGDFSVTVGTYVIGRSSGGLTVDITDLTGVWSSTATTHNVTYRTRDGGHAGLDTESPRLIGVTFLIVSDSGSITAVLTDLEAARTAWAPGVAKTCTVVAPGSRSYAWSGRTQGLQVDDRQVPFGFVTCSASFFCPDPDPTGGW